MTIELREHRKRTEHPQVSADFLNTAQIYLSEIRFKHWQNGLSGCWIQQQTTLISRSKTRYSPSGRTGKHAG
ncbi:hypothetical protein PO124_27070 [Bacillus licheniformis]|nr:hypothetical protein [Bacillus licheniformis]